MLALISSRGLGFVLAYFGHNICLHNYFTYGEFLNCLTLFWLHGFDFLGQENFLFGYFQYLSLSVIYFFLKIVGVTMCMPL